MKLSDAEAALFYELMWVLQFYVKQKLNLLPDITTIQQYMDASVEDKFQVRKALYDQPDLIDHFLQDNPPAFSADKLAILAQWKQFIAGDFYIERILKKYTIFIGQDDQVYGVVGLQEELEDIFYMAQLPILVKAVLLPFKDKIIYDGLFQRYNLYFGSGISGRLKETYLAAKQRGEILETLVVFPAKRVASVLSKSTKDWTPELAELTTLASKLKGGGGQPALHSPIFSLIKASIELGQMAVSDPENDQQLWQLLGKVGQAARKVERCLERQ
jgi:hypothetical protein